MANQQRLDTRDLSTLATAFAKGQGTLQQISRLMETYSESAKLGIHQEPIDELNAELRFVFIAQQLYVRMRLEAVKPQAGPVVPICLFEWGRIDEDGDLEEPLCTWKQRGQNIEIEEHGVRESIRLDEEESAVFVEMALTRALRAQVIKE